MVSNHTNHGSSSCTPAETYASVMQGKVLLADKQLPKVAWNQIKILVVANKDGKRRNRALPCLERALRLEFDHERHLLMTETLPKLQQYFLTHGIYVHFVDCNLNWDLDPFRNPYHVLRYMQELHDAHRTSAGLFLLVSFSRAERRTAVCTAHIDLRGKQIRIDRAADRAVHDGFQQYQERRRGSEQR